ncbi:hypothetical protein AVEN_23837-1 [Araneus ventricosus]|uniref:Uncharacterized protein n=1 Tax=Araneus ventricosus TaxID=182803 RepID=A0A4Y2N9L7_ARAVE|nr:hypothetical protein AVEN_23837-1 [Araneus ventricosus]
MNDTSFRVMDDADKFLCEKQERMGVCNDSKQLLLDDLVFLLVITSGAAGLQISDESFTQERIRGSGSSKGMTASDFEQKERIR